MALLGMRGLSVFISDIRNYHNKEQERLRVESGHHTSPIPSRRSPRKTTARHCVQRTNHLQKCPIACCRYGRKTTIIGLAGATADVYCYDVLSNKWTRLTPLGEPPSPRAAHVATAVGTMVVIQGGIGPAGLSAEDLHVLDLTQ
ncbi:Serine/threonine-protein phosphatase BSL2 [Zea mays]|uniref:Serine/threonine-protein phosphatase BSL2 n=1 Tax=Zea mays TaxID=4577 RepID=A0A3L6FMF1_MAIZE|nr:Serine/threonine-protein phosphatase BSL2 [Zea mays]